MKTIIFDFDGVVENTFELHKNNVEKFTGAKFSKKGFQELHNGNILANKNIKLKNVDWLKYQKFIFKEQSNLKIESQIKKFLLRLSKKYEFFIVTSGSSKNIKAYLKKNKINKIFKDVLGIELHKTKIDKFNFLFIKYNLKRSDCVFITDTLGDILEANKLKIKTIAIDFGFHNKKTLKIGKPFKIVSSFNEVEKILA